MDRVRARAQSAGRVVMVGSAILAGGFLVLSDARADTPPAADPALIARGKYLATVGDCSACHTANGGQKFAGGQYMPTPFGPISTPNITPDRDTGIGKFTDDQFYRVFHAGVGSNGEYLYPVMPFPWYTHVKRDDVLAIKAYLFSLAPVHAPRQPIHIAFPFNVRAGLGVWDAMFLKPGEFKPNPAQSDAVNRGDYLVNGLAHCGECHNKRNLMGATATAEPLQGGPIQQWYAPNITSDVRTGIGRFSDQDVFTYLKTGTDAAMGVVAGPMGQTVHESLRAWTDEDLHDVVAYLKSVPAKSSYAAVHDAAYAGGNTPGAQVYLNNCASCHQLNGEGLAGAVPKLAGNGAVIAGGPQDVIRVVLGGLSAQGSYAPMPGVGVGMTDQQVADVTNYIRQSWGNSAPANAGPGEVASLRAETHTLWNATRPDGCPSLAQPEISKVLSDTSTGIQPILAGTTLVNMVPNVDKILDKVNAGAPGLPQADVVNALTVAYCPIVLNDPKLPLLQKRVQLDQFGERVYTQIVARGKQ